MLIELKNGETYNGMLAACDSWMNIHLRDAICTSKVFSINQSNFYMKLKDGDRFHKIPEVYVRGSTIKYIRIPDEVIIFFLFLSFILKVVELVKEEVKEVRRQQKEWQKTKKRVGGPQPAQQGKKKQNNNPRNL
jgi:U6 snRNA-associated Sm-like protein LSm4